MERAMTMCTVMGALVFSISCAMLLEELIFGGLFRLFFAPRPERSQLKPQAGRPL